MVPALRRRDGLRGVLIASAPGLAARATCMSPLAGLWRTGVRTVKPPGAQSPSSSSSFSCSSSTLRSTAGATAERRQAAALQRHVGSWPTATSCRLEAGATGTPNCVAGTARR